MDSVGVTRFLPYFYYNNEYYYTTINILLYYTTKTLKLYKVILLHGFSWCYWVFTTQVLLLLSTTNTILDYEYN